MGFVSSVLFAGRNFGKCIDKDDTTRGVVGTCQTIGATDDVLHSSSIFSNFLNKSETFLKASDDAIETVFEKLGGKAGTLDKAVETTGAGTKIGAIAQKAVNPLLCVAAGVRVLKDDDQYAALIEETTAMGAMFSMEAIMKYARSAATNTPEATTGLAGKAAKILNNSSTIKELTETLRTKFKDLASTPNGSAKQTLVKVGVDLLFVAGSILAYNLGHKAGELISNRKKE